MGAVKVLLQRRGEPIRFQLQVNRIAQRTATIRAWGVKNCAFVVADAHTLPFRRQSFDLVACINLLHRVREPRIVVQEVERITKAGGILLASNSYDWNERYTPKELWFDNFLRELKARTWRLESENDRVPYTTMMYDRKYVLAFNHVQVFRKVR